MAATDARRRFVVLEHRWDGVHWDLMLEDGPALRTWALDRPPWPDTEGAAGQLAAHRLAYLDYEGTVSGDRGTVRQIDRGTFVSIVWEADRVVVRLHGTQVIGELELRRLGGPSSSERAGWAFRTGKVI